MQDWSFPCIEREKLVELYELGGDEDGAEFVLDIINTYIEDSEKRFAQLKAAIGAKDVTGIIKSAHALKSASMTVGAEKLSSFFKKMEESGRNNDIVGIDELFTCSEHEYFAVIEQFNDLKGKDLKDVFK